MSRCIIHWFFVAMRVVALAQTVLWSFIIDQNQKQIYPSLSRNLRLFILSSHLLLDVV